MELRNHPSMTWQHRRNWPPDWNGPHGPNNPLPQGEVGVLTGLETARPIQIDPHCILVMRYNDQEYLGTLFFDDENFLKEISAILNGHIGLSIAVIGSLDIA